MRIFGTGRKLAQVRIGIGDVDAENVFGVDPCAGVSCSHPSRGVRGCRFRAGGIPEGGRGPFGVGVVAVRWCRGSVSVWCTGRTRTADTGTASGQGFRLGT